MLGRPLPGLPVGRTLAGLSSFRPSIPAPAASVASVQAPEAKFAPISYPPSLYASAEEALRTVYGYAGFRDKQGEIIDRIISGQDVIVLMPTGGGKSLCYQIPSLVRSGVGLIISPLVSLMQDQVTQLQGRQVRAEAFNSTKNWQQKLDIKAKVMRGDLDLLYISPEMFVSDQAQEFLRKAPLALIAFDEAHCVSQWGHDFRSAYVEAAAVAATYEGVPRMALTATASAETMVDMVAQLRLQHAPVFVSSFDRPNLTITIAEKNKPKDQLLEFMEPRRGQNGVVYCLSRKKVEETAEFLRKRGWDAMAYHREMDEGVKAANLDRFLREDGVIMVATIAFGMGIDKPDVRFVVHLDLPSSLEAYYQEIGRAGRDGLPSHVWMVYGHDDLQQRRKMIEEGSGSDAHKAVKRRQLDALMGFIESAECRRSVVLRYFGEEHAGKCGQCDRCLDPVQTFDATIDALKIFAAVERTGERYGADYLTSILLGEVTDKAREKEHHRLDVFGAGIGSSHKHWRTLIRQLHAAGYLESPPDRHGGLMLTPKTIPVRNAEARLELVRPREFARPRPSPQQQSSGAQAVRGNGFGGRGAPMRPVGHGGALAFSAAALRGSSGFSITGLPADRETLWEEMRTLRREIAAEEKIPLHAVMDDATIVAIVGLIPQSVEELARVSGMGEGKAARFGERILEVTNAHADKLANQRPKTISVTGFGMRRG